jgi:predicted P-loop ATPase
VEVTSVIDTDTPIDYRRLYAQALHEIDEGMPFRFYPQEEAEIQEHNRAFQQHTSAEEAVTAFFEPAPKDAKYHTQATDIQAELKRHLKASDVPNLKMLTVTLKQNGFIYGSCNGRRGWYVRLREEKKVR